MHFCWINGRRTLAVRHNGPPRHTTMPLSTRRGPRQLFFRSSLARRPPTPRGRNFWRTFSETGAVVSKPGTKGALTTAISSLPSPCEQESRRNRSWSLRMRGRPQVPSLFVGGPLRGPPPPVRSCAACPAVCAVLKRGQNQVHHTHMTPVPFFEKRRNGHVGICLCYKVYASTDTRPVQPAVSNTKAKASRFAAARRNEGTARLC